VTGPAALARQEAGGLLCAVRADLPDSAAASEMRAAPNPRAFTRVVWGLTLRPPGSPGGLSSGFPFARRGSSASSAFGWFPFVRRSPLFPSAVARFRFPSVSLRVPFPLSNLHVSAAAGRARRRWSRSTGTKVSSSASAPRLGRPRSARAAGGQRPGTRDAAAGSPVTGGRERTTSSRPTAIAEHDRNAGLPSSLSPIRRG
jgi:hypothetical protein